MILSLKQLDLVFLSGCVSIIDRVNASYWKQAGAELGQAQYKLGLDFSIFTRFSFSRLSLVESVS